MIKHDMDSVNKFESIIIIIIICHVDIGSFDLSFTACILMDFFNVNIEFYFFIGINCLQLSCFEETWKSH